MYLCHWPNGDFSLVAAPSAGEAAIALDEWGGADLRQLHWLSSFMADFSLTDEGEIKLNALGELTCDAVWDLCYPRLREVLVKGRGATEAEVRQAVLHERTRLIGSHAADEPRAEQGKPPAPQMDTSAAAESARRVVDSGEGEDGKRN